MLRFTTLTIGYSLVDWIGFLVFNIGNPAVEAVPTGTRIFIGLLQAISVRNAGFQVVPLAVVAPAVKCVSLCYFPCQDADVTQGSVSCHDVHRHLSDRVEVRLRRFIEDPLHVHRSVRSTNVYEEQSLGVFHEDDWHLEGDSRIAIWGNYILQHSRTQLSFGMGLSLSQTTCSSLIHALHQICGGSRFA